MALDKQKILNELGSIVNQLQSADCGCMGKLFSNSGPPNSNGNPMAGRCGGNMQACCGQGCNSFNSPCAGEPFSGAQHCMGSCNPPKLYADTYSYLNQNLMQPVVKEVYDELKSITPANTVMNNPMGAQMGLLQGNNPNQGNVAPSTMQGGLMGNQHRMPSNMGHVHAPHLHFGNADTNDENPNNVITNPNQSGVSPMNQGMCPMGQGRRGPSGGMMGGMGAQIVNMMTSSAKSNNFKSQDGSPSHMTGDNIPQDPGMGQLTENMPSSPNLGQYNSSQMQNNMNYSSMNNVPGGNPDISTNQYNMTPNIPATNLQGNASPANINQMSPGSQQMGNMNAMSKQNPNSYGQHSAGMNKFNEMFPGVADSSLGFDPMAIAIQMNPANQQRSAMDTMQKMMMNHSGGMGRIMDSAGNVSPVMQPVVDATKAASANIVQPNQSLPQAPIQQQQLEVPSEPIQQQQLGADVTQMQVQQRQPEGLAPVQSNQTPQQVYTAHAPASTMYQPPITAQKQQIPSQEPPQVQRQQYQQSSQQMIDPKRGAFVNGGLPTVYEGSVAPNMTQKQQPPASISSEFDPSYKEPIFPADNSRNLLLSHHFSKPKRFEFNTLGQPVQMLPGKNYHEQIPDLPQTLSPQATGKINNAMKYSNVKSTVSKTSLVGNRPIGRTPSRTQLQHIYNQYKGSQSFTQQNINMKPSEYVSYSEGNINIPQGNIPQPAQIPVERVGGDTIANNQVAPAATKLEPINDQVGDVPVEFKPLGDSQATPVKNTRNGLQDLVFSTYPTSTKWSFHGTTPPPFSVGYRARNKW